MLTLRRLVHLIETRSEDLAKSLLAQVKASQAVPDYRHVPDEELYDRVLEIYAHLSHWLLSKDEHQVERRYLKIGAERARQNVPFNQVAWVILATKAVLWQFLENQVSEENSAHSQLELELLQLLDRFFDRAIYFASVGHDRSCGRGGPS